MASAITYAPFIGRILIGILFVVAGAGKLGDVAGFTGYLTSGGLPVFLAWPSILFEILVGLLLIAGFQTRIAAILAAAFCLLAGVLYHSNLADQMQMTALLKNLAIAGGLLVLASHGPGRLSVDKV